MVKRNSSSQQRARSDFPSKTRHFGPSLSPPHSSSAQEKRTSLNHEREMVEDIVTATEKRWSTERDAKEDEDESESPRGGVEGREKESNEEGSIEREDASCLVFSRV